MSAGRFWMTALLAALAACAPAVETGTSSTDKRPVEERAPGESLDARALQERLIAYAASLHGTSDASEEAFSGAMKVTLTPFEPGRPGGAAGDQPMVDGYAFQAGYGPLAGGMKIPFHGVSVFRPGGKPLTDDPHAPCFWTSEAAGQALVERGYTRGGERAFQRGRLQQYLRDSSDGGTVFYAELLTYVAGGAAAETCVYEVRFAGDVR